MIAEADKDPDRHLYIIMGEERSLFRIDPRALGTFYTFHYYELLNQPTTQTVSLSQEAMDNAINLAGSAPPTRAPSGTSVIGKQKDLERPGALREGERRLNLPDRGNPRANWSQNSGRLREAMREGRPIRDVSVSPTTGRLQNNTGFLRAERNLLRNRGVIASYEPVREYLTPAEMVCPVVPPTD